MIALQAFKYIVYDYCINTFMGKLLINFNVRRGKIRLSELKVGMYLSKIKVIDRGFTFDTPAVWTDCIITKLIWRFEDTYFVQFSWGGVNKNKINCPNPVGCHMSDRHPELMFYL